MITKIKNLVKSFTLTHWFIVIGVVLVLGLFVAKCDSKAPVQEVPVKTEAVK